MALTQAAEPCGEDALDGFVEVLLGVEAQPVEGLGLGLLLIVLLVANY